MSCQFCGKAFNGGFNLRRHENEHCPLRDQEREMSETESQAMDSGDDSFTYEKLNISFFEFKIATFKDIKQITCQFFKNYIGPS